MITKLLRIFQANGKSALLDALYPPICVTCRNRLAPNEESICLACLLELPYTESHLTPLLALDQKFVGRMPVEAIYTWVRFAKKTKIQTLLHALKYHQKPELVRIIGKHYGYLLRSKEELTSYDCLVPIPMHPRKKAMRGYNQAEEFALGLSESLGIPVDRQTLQKRRFTKSQTTFSRQNRFQNLQGSFVMNSNIDYKAKKVILVDDVLTTGATLEEAGSLLYKAEISNLSIITIATAF